MIIKATLKSLNALRGQNDFSKSNGIRILQKASMNVFCNYKSYKPI